MAQEQHTPGPWEIRESKEGEGVCIYAGKYGIGKYSIGKVWDLNGNPENKANARLIAAAPDMFEALRDVVTFAKFYHGKMEDTLGDEALDALCETALAAITKAEGPSTRRDGPVLREGVA